MLTSLVKPIFGLAVLAAVGTYTSSINPSVAATISGTSLTLTSADIGSSFVIYFDGSVEGDLVTGLTSKALFTFEGFEQVGTSSKPVVEANFEVQLFNTTATNSSDPLNSRVSVVGFDVDKNLIGVGTQNSTGNTSTTGIFTYDSSGQMANLGKVDICFSENNCSGGSNGGVTNFTSTNSSFSYLNGTFNFTLAFQGTLNDSTSITLSDPGVRYQSIDGQGFNDDSGTGVAPGGSQYWVEVPEGALF